MFYTTYHAASATKDGTEFFCPEVIKFTPVQVSLTPARLDEIEMQDFIRHFNRIQSSGSKKAKIELDRNLSLRYYDNRRENEHRSKERVVMARR